MKFVATKISGLFVIEPEFIEDERGFFGRTWCRREFEEQGLNPDLGQCNLSFNRKKGTLRGLHFQAEPHAEDKLVRCTMGAIWDVAVDIRPESPTFKEWVGVELTAENRKSFYIPKGFAHGFITLANNSEVFYQMSEVYHPECGRGIRWDDKSLRIAWPAEPAVISSKDSQLSELTR